MNIGFLFDALWNVDSFKALSDMDYWSKLDKSILYGRLYVDSLQNNYYWFINGYKYADGTECKLAYWSKAYERECLRMA